MNNQRKRLSGKMRAVSKMGVMTVLVLILLFSVGCSGDKNETAVTKSTSNDIVETEISKDKVKTETETSDTDKDVEEIVEVLPVPRITTLSGGHQVVTPEGIIVNKFDYQLVNEIPVSYVDVNGLELKKSYDITLVGTTTKESIVSIYLLDGSKIEDITKLNMAEVLTREEEMNIKTQVNDGLILDSTDVIVTGSINETLILTNSIRNTTKGILYMSLADTVEEVIIDEITVKRHVGELKFSDEFDYDGLPNEDWTYELGGNGWGNGELQYYTGNNLDNASVSDGELTITAMEEKKDNNDYTSARMRTKESFTYGRYEIKAKIPYGRGTWPAIWMLPAGNNFGNWPNSGEIDIMEHVGFDMDVVHGSLHMSEFNFRKNNHPTAIMEIPEVDTTYHRYTLEWTPYQIDMYIDNYHYMTFKNDGQGPKHWPFDEKFYLLLNVAVGGAWGGQQGIDSIFPQQMVIDYVRIYDLEDTVVDLEAPETVEEVNLDVQGTTVFFDFKAAEDNYKIANYEVTVLNEKSSTTSLVNKTNGFVFGLDDETNYNVTVVAIDDSGNKSEAYMSTIKTETTTTNNLNEWITPNQSYFISGASMSELEEDNYISGFEADDLMAYRINVKNEGEYKLELEISGKLFDGEVSLLNNEQEELLTFVARKTGDKEVYEIVMTEGFKLFKGEQTLFLKTIKNGYQIKNVRLINGE